MHSVMLRKGMCMRKAMRNGVVQPPIAQHRIAMHSCPRDELFAEDRHNDF